MSYSAVTCALRYGIFSFAKHGCKDKARNCNDNHFNISFTKTIIAIINSVKIRKTNSPLLITIRNICCADAAASIFSLQRNMNASFGNPTGKDAYIFNIATGAAVCIIVFLLGFLMIFFKEKNNGKIKNCKS